MEIYQTICRFLNVTLEFLPKTSRGHLAPQVPQLRAISWLRQAGLWDAAARLTPRHLRLPLRRMPIHKPGAVQLDPVDRRYLILFYREDIRKLESLLDQSLERWLR